MLPTWFMGLVAAACVVIAVMFIVQTAVWLMMIRLLRQVQATVEDVRTRFEPKLEEVLVTVAELRKSVVDVSATVGVVSTEVRAVSSAVTVTAERISVLATESAEEIRDVIRTTSIEIKMLVASTSTDVQQIVQHSKVSAQTAVERVDLVVERTAVRVEETGAFIQHQVLDPVREVSAIVIGIKVALETLLGYPERKQINQAYSEEELFI